MPKFKMYYGLGGGFGGARYYGEILEFDNEAEAIECAWEMACDEFESYEGLHGLRDVDQIMEEDNIDNLEEAMDVWADERESWLDYKVEQVPDGYVETEDF